MFCNRALMILQSIHRKECLGVLITSCSGGGACREEPELTGGPLGSTIWAEMFEDKRLLKLP